MQAKIVANAMAIYSPNEMVWCKVFLLSIRGEALAWFHSLCPRTIDNFEMLRNLFEQQFASSIAQNLTYMELTKLSRRKTKA